MAKVRMSLDGLDGLDHIITLDEDGSESHVFLAARAPGQVAAQTTSGASVARGASSGNPNFDPASGRFATKTNKQAAPGDPTNPVVINPSGLPQGITQEEWDRRKDSVKDAARSIETFDIQAANNFLTDRVSDLSTVDVAAFQADVIQQKIDDLTDIFADQMTRGRNQVTMKAPNSYSTRALGKLNDAQIDQLINRLKARGFSDKQINKKVVSRLPSDKKNILKAKSGNK